MAQAPRVPKSCPPSWAGRYRVATGDTLARIARFFHRPLKQLHKANPHIRNPNQLIPGDILCVPGQVPYPCTLILEPVEPVPPGTECMAFVHIAAQGGQAVTMAAALPPPRHWGNYDLYLGEVLTNRSAGKFSSQLFQSPSGNSSWAGTVLLPTVVSLIPNSRIRILPIDSETGTTGPALLQGSLKDCLQPELTPITSYKRSQKVKKTRRHRRPMRGR